MIRFHQRLSQLHQLRIVRGDGIVKEEADILVQRLVIILHRQQIVAFVLHDLPGALLLATHFRGASMLTVAPGR